MSQNFDYDPVLIRALMLLDKKHPDPLGSVATYGNLLNVGNVIKATEGLGFKLHHSETCAAFIDHIKYNKKLLLALIEGKVFPDKIAAALSNACERLDPLYIVRIYSGEGTVPDTGKHYKSIFYCFAPVSEAPAAERVSQATKQLFHQANEEAFAKNLPSEAMQAELERHRSSD